MKNYIIKMMLVVLIISSIINIYKENNKEKIVFHGEVVNSLAYQSELTYNELIEEKVEIVYKGLTLDELGAKIDKVFNSRLKGYGKIVAEKALEKDVDPVVAASIMLLETGCKWECSSLVKYKNNVGGMRGSRGYMSFKTLDSGIEAFINNLARNYYAKGLNTPEKMNKKYATSKTWAKKVNNYVNMIM